MPINVYEPFRLGKLRNQTVVPETGCIQVGVSSSTVTRPSLEGEGFEIVVIGGGVNGVAIARECARAGRGVLLLEKNDFASGTTSRSTRIIHGGLRYLQYAEIGLVRESLRERDRLIREHPHLVRPLRFVLAVDGEHGQSALKIRAGLWLYKKLAGQNWRATDPHRAKREIEKRLDSGARWSIFEYDDAQCEFPERLVAEWAGEAIESGAILRNYSQVLDVQHANGRITGVLFRDRLTGEESAIKCRWVINAAGPWVDQVCADASIPTGGPLIGGVRGSHLVVPHFEGAPETALYTQAIDGRPVFVIPWNGQILIGSTEIPDATDPGRAIPSDEEISYLLKCANRLFPRAAHSASDIHYAFSGIRPLPYMEGASPSAVTRKSILYDHQQDGITGMMSIVGGKLTTAASLARRCARAIGLQPERQTRESVPIGVASGIEATLRQWAHSIACTTGVEERVVLQVASMHGPRTPNIVRLAALHERMLQPLCEHTTHIVAEAVYAFRRECAITLADILLRRVPVALGACWSTECGRAAGTRIGAALGWRQEQIEWELETLEIERAAFLHKPDSRRTVIASPPEAQRFV
jgi:glycerol-3-phosphate dehydrogenase